MADSLKNRSQELNDEAEKMNDQLNNGDVKS